MRQAPPCEGHPLKACQLADRDQGSPGHSVPREPPHWDVTEAGSPRTGPGAAAWPRKSPWSQRTVRRLTSSMD